MPKKTVTFKAKECKGILHVRGFSLLVKQIARIAALERGVSLAAFLERAVKTEIEVSAREYSAKGKRCQR